ncbi:peptide-N4-asparagine amidase [Frateuria aurantia]
MQKMTRIGQCLALGGLIWRGIGLLQAAEALPAMDRASAHWLPQTAPACTVRLFGPTRFAAGGEGHRMDSQPLAFDYQLPAGCGTHWSRVVLTLDYSVPAGRQFDRTASLWLDGVNLFMGTTEEPGATRAPSWSVSRDLTDYQIMFLKAGHGRYALNNWVDQRYTSPIEVSARLAFYKASEPTASTVRRVPSAVMPMSVDPLGQAFTLQTGDAQLVRRVVFPRNTEAVFVDVLAQSQSNDEQWYNCVPDRIVDQTRNYALEAPTSGMPFQQCAGSAFRMVEALVDGQPAGLAPVTPWTFTGGVDPYLWRPTPDIQTLDFRPYRIDLSAFAGLLDDGRPHQLALRVLGSNHYFSIAGNVLIYTDARVSGLHGGLLLNTLATRKLQPVVTLAMQPRSDGDAVGRALVEGDFAYTQRGYLDTPEGRRVTEVKSRVSLRNDQHFTRPRPGQFRQLIEQQGHAELSGTVTLGADLLYSYRYTRDDPLHLDILRSILPDSSFTTDIHIRRGLEVDFALRRPGRKSFRSQLANGLQSQALTHWKPGGNGIIESRGQQGRQWLNYRDSQGGCMRRSVVSRDGRVQQVRQDASCIDLDVSNRTYYRPDGSPAYP